MALPDFSMRQLLEAGVHFGHQAHRWNPKMSEFIFGTRNNIHIIDLAQSVPALHRALQAVSDTVANGGRILFVGTKRQAQDAIAEAAKRSAQYYVNSRWLGGIKEMGGLPDLLFVIDTNKEDIAIKEARRLGLPVAAVVDTNCDPNGITYIVPGNDDASRAITLYCDLAAKAAIDGISRAQGELGVDTGAAAKPMVEELPAATEAPGHEVLSGPRGVADDLTKLHHVSPTIEKKLNDLGIFHYWQIAGLGPEAAHKIGEEVGLPGRVEGWIAQSKELTAE